MQTDMNWQSCHIWCQMNQNLSQSQLTPWAERNGRQCGACSFVQGRDPTEIRRIAWVSVCLSFTQRRERGVERFCAPFNIFLGGIHHRKSDPVQALLFFFHYSPHHRQQTIKTRLNTVFLVITLTFLIAVDWNAWKKLESCHKALLKVFWDWIHLTKH